MLKPFTYPTGLQVLHAAKSRSYVNRLCPAIDQLCKNNSHLLKREAVFCWLLSVKVKVTVHTLDIAPLRSESPPQKRSGMAHVLKGFHSFTCTPTRSSAIGMSHTCLCLPSYNWYSFTDPGGMED